MPTVLRAGPYRFFFWSQDRLKEPAHIHVQRDKLVAKVWLDPVRLERAGGFNSAELRRIIELVERNESALMESWDAFGR
ncbi:MAG: DUF4160 domain-containing protein [Planctomycetes bacterium]|nr:DUF4160 domain-containing protein [Planctomycetota bacterium]